MAKRRTVKKSIMDQLVGAHEYQRDMANDYMTLWDIKQELQKDILTRGAKVEKTDSRGTVQRVNNESIEQAIKINAQMLKIAGALGIDVAAGDSDDDKL